MADANKTLITRAEVTSMIVAATGRRAQYFDGETSDAASWTGIRDLTGLLMSGKVKSGRLLVARRGFDVWWIFDNLAVADAGVGQNWQILDAPSGIVPFRPPYRATHDFQGASTGGSMRLMVTETGRVYVYYAGAPAISTIMHTLTVQPWPTTLPGVADGDQVVV